MFLFKRKSFAFLLSIFLVCLTALLVTFTFNTQSKTAHADTVTYRSGANSVSTSYKNGRYYANLMQVPITGDGVTDVLAVAMSQMGYQESATDGSYSGESGGSGNYTEFNYNMGSYAASDGYHYAWCASFVSWSLLQSQCTSQNTMGAWCRNHYGDSNYIWREVGCPGWYTQLGQCGYQRTRASGYIPKSGDLIFFYSSSTSSTIGHIGIVVWCNGSTVYTIEGNTSSGTGVEANGGGVYYKSYAVSNTRIAGYGALPYKTNSSALKVDYSGAKKTAGLYMAKTSFTVTTSSGSSYTIPQYRMFKVNSISGSTANITYNGANYTGTLNSNTIQISASTSASQGNPVSSIIVHESSSFNAGGTSIPSGYTSDPCVKVTGLIGSVNNYWELEKYAHNKSLVLREFGLEARELIVYISVLILTILPL